MFSLKHVLLLISLNICAYSIYGNKIHFIVNETEGVKTDRYEKSECTINGTQTGTCKYTANCPAALEALSTGTRPEICGFHGKEVIVCCVSNDKLITTINETLGISKRMCELYERQLCETRFRGLVPPRIVIAGGIKSRIQEFPHMAAIGYGSASQKEWHCGGSLISDRYVLSAAHCTHPGDSLGSARWVRLGDLSLESNNDDARPEDFEIIQHINHPDYKPPIIYNDIALYKLDRTVHFNAYIKPICLHTSYLTPNGRGAATGWGRLGYIHPVSDFLMKVDLTFVSISDCSTFSERSEFQLPNGIDGKSMICAGEQEGVKDTCQGDSGGPLSIHGKGCLYKQVGITSVGALCGLPNSPGIYTRIAYFVLWIESIVWRSE